MPRSADRSIVLTHEALECCDRCGPVVRAYVCVAKRELHLHLCRHCFERHSLTLGDQCWFATVL